jgi:hypothetical protein
MLIEHRPSYLN